jgi:hypothetical protein
MTSLLNRKAVRNEALRIAAPRKFTRVSKSFLDKIETHVLELIAGEIHRHPSIGRTLR